MKRTLKFIGALAVAPLLLGAISGWSQLLPPGSSPAPPPAAGAPGGNTGDRPRIQFAETRFDFGKIKASTPCVHEYIFTNTGNAVLEITAVQPGCPGCTTALPWDRQVQPGMTGKIPIQFNPSGFSGTVSKSATVTCNDPTQPTTTLFFQATIWVPVEVQPAYVYFQPVEGEDTNETKIVRIVNNLDEPMTLQPPRVENPLFKAEVKTVRPGKEFALHLSYAGGVTNHPVPIVMALATSSTNYPEVKVTVGAMPQPALLVTPQHIQIPYSPNGTLPAGHTHIQLIRNNSSTPMKLTESTVNAEGVKVQVNESQPGKMYTLTLTFPPDFKMPTGEPVVLTVKTTHPKHPVITVPLVQAGTPGPVARPATGGNVRPIRR